MFAGFEILGISRAHVGALKVPYEDALEVCPKVDAVRGEMLEPCSGAFCKVERQVLDDEEFVVCPACLTSEAAVFQPHGRVGVLGVLDDVRRRAETRQEWRLSDPLYERLRVAGVRAWAMLSISNLGMSAMVIRVAVTIV